MKLSHNVDLTTHNTLGLKSTAAKYLQLDTLEELQGLNATVAQTDWFVLAGGSNVVLPEFYDGIVVKPNFKGIEQVWLSNEVLDDFVYIKAFAGEVWHAFVEYCLNQSWLGLENLALIPGTVGAAPIQNIGAYGVEVCELIESVTYWDCAQGKLLELSAKQCRFAYRDSVFKQGHLGRVIIVSVTFKLMHPKRWQAKNEYSDLKLTLKGVKHPNARDVFAAVVAIRSGKLPDPKKLGNAGSFFKNPIVSAAHFQKLLLSSSTIPHYPQPNGDVKLAAAWLIDQCGFKGQVFGNVGVHARQALVLVNIAGIGKAVADDVISLAQTIQEAVNSKFEVQLEPEPVFIK